MLKCWHFVALQVGGGVRGLGSAGAPASRHLRALPRRRRRPHSVHVPPRRRAHGLHRFSAASVQGANTRSVRCASWIPVYLRHITKPVRDEHANSVNTSGSFFFCVWKTCIGGSRVFQQDEFFCARQKPGCSVCKGLAPVRHYTVGAGLDANIDLARKRRLSVFQNSICLSSLATVILHRQSANSLCSLVGSDASTLLPRHLITVLLRRKWFCEMNVPSSRKPTEFCEDHSLC